MLRLWGRSNSINVQKAMWCVAELGLRCERIDAGREFGRNKEEWFLKMNPNGLVPVIDDRGFILWESNAIVRYLAETYDQGGLCPDDPKLRGQAGQWMDWASFSLGGPMTTVFWQLIRTPDEQRDRAALDKAAESCRGFYALLDRHLQGRDYMLGERLTMADIPVGAFTHRWYALDVPHGDFPALRAWYEKLRQRDGFKAHVMLPLS
ncbi:glutathione S-transferase family protein [Oceanibaculum pacificum]|uniref:Glutathione S-transferase n=1 Tax=Oceanibaculum pacificum TaxID=580166 RepID=A0A154VUJ0_9PROT|nr:glutathione S-transferase family protein [Oceanibaculum pacificum]KZD04859.1 glutathione S-transferase [Oceanibaculum pacificum]